MIPASRPGASVPAGSPAGLWEIRLLGGLAARSGDVLISRLPTRQIAALLARLALYPQRAHAREELMELLWPGVELDVARNRLRHALSTLRRLLQSPDVAGAEPIRADRNTVRLNADAFVCDAVLFERHVRAGRHGEARALYRGDLLPGFYDDWVIEERMRLEGLYDGLGEAAGPPLAAVAEPAARAAAPAPDLVEMPMRRLPALGTSFFGRHAERDRLIAAIADRRLVTITGLAGSGKTRLAIEAAGAAQGFELVAFVALAESRSAEQAADRIRATLGLPRGSGSAIDQVRAGLAGQRGLLVVDNFEQLAGTAGIALLADLLERLPALHLLVTSQRALQLESEYEIVLDPLPLPAADARWEAAALNPGVALFVDRARAVRADFQLGPRNVADVVGVCRALEGLPLAIEIAASRVRAYTPKEMRGALASGLSFVTRTGPRAARDGRHASLAAALAWSWQLLDAAQRRMLSALTVFRGGWTAEAAMAVVGQPDTRDLLESLVVHSLVRAEPEANGDMRFAMPESVRQFVAGQATRAAAKRVRTRHRSHFLDLAQRAADAGQAIAESDLPNIAEALATALSDACAGEGAALVLALKGHLLSNGAPPDMLRLLGRTIDALPAADPRGGDLLCLWSRLLLQAGEAEPAEAAARRAMARAGDDPVRRADALFTRTNVEWVWRRRGEDVIEPAREACRLAVESGSIGLQARAAMLLAAITLWHLDDPAAADRLFESAEGLFRRLGDSRAALSTLPGRVACLQAQGLHERAIELALFGERRAADRRHVETQLLLQNRLSLSYESVRRYDKAWECCRRQALLARRQHMAYHAALALWNACRPLAHLRRAEASAQLMGFSEAYWVDRYGPIAPADRRHIERVRRLVVAQIGAERWRTAYARGAALSMADGYELLRQATPPARTAI
ncbi:MAG: hypothetical protein JSR59_01810 [Proteobacteria bacterium]|nr:hypothetical protein [Pseudomonadota bacterium]